MLSRLLQSCRFSVLLDWRLIVIIIAVVLTIAAYGGIGSVEVLPAHKGNAMRLLPVALISFIAIVFVSACMNVRGDSEIGTTGLVEERAPFRAQVVGVQWISPVVRRDYPTEWQLLWVLGLAQPNKNDDMVRTEPENFTSVKPVSAIIFAWHGRAIYDRYFSSYMRETVMPFVNRYATDSTYFYTIQPKSTKAWREVAGIRVEFAIADRPAMSPETAQHHVRDRITRHFGIGDIPDISTRDTPPDVRMTVGGANAGFTSLNAALDYLEANPKESVWVMSWDSPEFPNDESMSETSALLVLAGPHFDTEREPLAWIGRPAVGKAEDFEVQPGLSRAVQAWRATAAAAAAQAAKPLTELGYVIHDAGRSSDVAGERLATLGQALAEPLPEFDLLKQGFNTTALLGDTGTGSALTNIALAVAYAHHRGVPVMVAGTTEAHRPTAVMVTPPARARVFDPDKTWFRARGERNAYLPWWGLRRDFDWNTYMQGFSD